MTAVEYIKEKLLDKFWYRNRTFEQIIEQAAKAIEKEQMETTWNNAIDAELKDKWQSFDQFHDETFK